MKFFLLIIILYLQSTFSWADSKKTESTNSHSDSSVITYPEGCLKESFCAIKTSSKFKMDIDKGRLAADGESQFIIVENSVKVISGQFLFESENSLRIETLYGSILLNKGKILLDIEKEKITVYSLGGVVDLDLKGYDERISVPKGFSTWFSGVESNGKAFVDFLQPVNPDKFISLWAGLNSDSKKSFKKEVIALRMAWLEASQLLGQKYGELANKRIEDHKRHLASVKRRRIKIENENKALREIFRKKNYLD